MNNVSESKRLAVYTALLIMSLGQLSGQSSNGNKSSSLTFPTAAQNQGLTFNSVLKLVNGYPGIAVNAQSGSTYHMHGDGTGSDRLDRTLMTYSGSATYYFGQAGGTGFASNYSTKVCNATGSILTFSQDTSVTSNVNGNSSMTLPPIATNSPPYCAVFTIDTDGFDWDVDVTPGADVNGYISPTLMVTSPFTSNAAISTDQTIPGLTYVLAANTNYIGNCQFTYTPSSITPTYTLKSVFTNSPTWIAYNGEYFFSTSVTRINVGGSAQTSPLTVLSWTPTVASIHDFSLWISVRVGASPTTLTFTGSQSTTATNTFAIQEGSGCSFAVSQN